MHSHRTKRMRPGRTMASQSLIRHSAVVDKILLQPWFLPQRIAFAIHALVPPDYWYKMRYFFDDYGCLICGRESNYHSNGMCKSCYDKVRKKLIASLKRRWGSRPNRRLDLVLLRQEKLAKKLLKRFARPQPLGPRRYNLTIPPRSNPVYEALIARQC